jgi:hypothetical protein
MANLHRINLTGASNNDLPSSSIKPNIPQRNSNSQCHPIHQDNYRSHHLTPSTISDLLLSNSSSFYSQYHSLTTSSTEQASNTSNLPIQHSSHPLDSSISPQDICMIQSSFFRACHSCDGQLLSYNAIPIPSINNNSFVNLLTFQSPIDDSIIHHILDIMHQTNTSYKFLDTNFTSSLIQNGWSHAYLKFFLHENSSRFAHSTKVKPTLSSDIILIPVFIHASLWVAIVHRLIHGKVHFFYTDDLNSTNT